MTGRFIALEGQDGSGTTLQTHALAMALRARGHVVLETREPTGGAIGSLARAMLATSPDPLDPRALALLFAADRVDHLVRTIEPALARGECVVSDRYVLSSFAYQALDCDAPWVRGLHGSLRWPDLTLVLEVPARVALERVRERDRATGQPKERFDDAAIQATLEASYRRFSREEGLPGVHGIDGTRTPNEVTASIVQICVSALGL